jgi:uncharacterized protein (DUF433 family)
MGMDWRSHIEVNPDVLVGKPVVQGTRIAVEQVIGLLGEGWPESDILAAFPTLTHEHVLACLAYAGAVLKDEELISLDS